MSLRILIETIESPVTLPHDIPSHQYAAARLQGGSAEWSSERQAPSQSPSPLQTVAMTTLTPSRAPAYVTVTLSQLHGKQRQIYSSEMINVTCM